MRRLLRPSIHLLLTLALLGLNACSCADSDKRGFVGPGGGGTNDGAGGDSTAAGGETTDNPPSNVVLAGQGGQPEDAGGRAADGGTTGGDGGLAGESGLAGGQGGESGSGDSDCAVASSLTCADSLQCQELACGGYLWAGGHVPFELHFDGSQAATFKELEVLSVIDAWSVSSEAVDFAHCDNDDCSGHERWLDVQFGQSLSLGPSVSSGAQVLTVPESATLEHIAHEIGHVLGLADVWRRPDRDRYLKLSESAFCEQGGHWDLSTCTPGALESMSLPTRRSTGLLGPFEADSAMNLAGSEVCEASEPDQQRSLPTLADGSALTELYRTAEGWSPFVPLGRDLANDLPLDHSIADDVWIAGAPALASRTYPQLDIYVRGTNQRIYVKPFRPGQDLDWVDWQSLDCCFDSDPGAVSWGYNRTDIFARSIDGEIQWRALSPSGGFLVWGLWTSIGKPPTGAASGPGVTSRGPDRLDVFVRGGDDYLYQTSYEGASWSSWEKLGDMPFVGTPAVAVTGDDRLDVVVAGSGGTLHRLSFDGAWAPGYELVSGEIEAGTSPTLASSAGKLHLYVDTPGTHHLSESVLDGDSWGPWRDLGGMLAGTPAAIGVQHRSHVDVAAIINDNGTDGVWQRSWPYERPCYAGDASTCGCLEPCDGECPTYAPAASDPFHYVNTSGADVWVFVTEDQHVYEVSGLGELLLTDLSMSDKASAFAVGNPSANVRHDGYEQVIYRSVNGHVYSFWWAGAWYSGSLTAITGAPKALGDAAPHIRSDNVDTIIYRAANNDIYELYLWGGWWYAGDLTAYGAAPPAAGDPKDLNRADGLFSRIYRGVDGHLIDIYWSGAAWLSSDVTASAASIASAGDGAPYVRSDNLNAIVYRAIDDHVHELSTAADGHVWTDVDLTAAAVAPSAIGDPRGYVRSDGVDAVVYRATDDHVYELRRSGDAWTATDLTIAATAPDAAGEAVPYVRTDSVSAVAFRGADNGIYEMALVNDSWTMTTLYQPP